MPQQLAVARKAEYGPGHIQPFERVGLTLPSSGSGYYTLLSTLKIYGRG